MTTNSPIKKTDFNLSLEEAQRVFKDILPKDLVIGIIKAKINDDQTELKNFDIKIRSFIESYQAKLCNFDLNMGEQLLWVHDVTKGIIHRELVEKWLITNFRAFKLFPKTQDRPHNEIKTIGLHISDTVVMNQYRASSGNRIGNFVGSSSGGGFVGVSTSTSKSTSRTFGDLVFLFAGKEALSFKNISDPSGIRKMILTLKKQSISV